LAGELDVDLLLRAVRDGREVVRANAAGVLGFVGNAPKRAAMSLAILLRDSEAIVRSAAAEALERLGPELAAPVAFWLTVALADPDANVRERMVNLLAATHAVMPEALIEGLRVDADAAWTTILPVFDRLGNAGVPTLAKALANPSGLIRINAAQGLELLAKRGADAVVDALEAKFNDPINQVRSAAARAIDAIKGGKPRPPRVLEPDPIDIAGFYERRLDASSLEGDHPTATPERLARVLRDGRAWVRANAATLLGFSPSAEVVPSLGSLVALARDEAIEVRAAAIDAVGRIAADFDAPRGGFDRLTLAGVLVEALDDRALRVRKTASAALSALGSAAFPALSLGLDTVTERNLAELTALLVALGDDAMNALPDALSPLAPELHLGALLVLRAFPRDGLAPHRAPVEALSDAQDQHVRAAAVTLLDKIDGKDLVPSTLEPTPLPLPEFADALLSRDVIAERADELRFDLLTHAISDGRDVVRANAATGLEVLGTGREVAWPYLVRALRDPSVEVRVRAAQALAVFPPRRDVAFDLVQALDDASPRVVQAAEAGLRAYGEFAIDAFMYALDDAPELVGKTILPMFGALAEKAVDAFILAQRYDSTQVRKNALIGLRLLDKSLAKGARPTVALARRDEDREVRMEALATLDWLDGVEHSMLREPRPLPSEGFATGPIDESELAALTESFDAKILVELLWDGRRAVRENAATAMGLLGRFDPLLAILLKDPVDAVKEAAAKTLLSLGKKSLPAASSLVEALSEDNDLVRTAARDSLIGLGKAALPALIAGLWVPGDLARRTVVPILEKLGKVATPAIIQALEHPSQLVVLNALQTLGRLYAQDPEGTTRAMDKVKALVRHPLPAIIGAAQKCLFRLEGRTPAEFQKDPVPMPIPGFDKGPLALDVLRQGAPNLDTAWMISALADGRPVVRENAARAAGFMQRALKDLLTPLTIALKDGIPEVQVAAAEAFANLRTADDVAVPALTFALRGATERVKRACLVALDAYGPERVAAAITQHLVGREDWMLQTIGKVAARMSEVLVPALARFAQKPDESLIARENAVRVIGDLGQKARGAEAALVSLLPEMEGMLACKAAFALGAVARPSKELIAAMQKRLEVDPRPSLHKEVRSAVKIIKRRLPPGA
ncbi:MAG: HEAT repeat domain-containing protein, partial [Deltaproteobacteria bacterium]|nr:HEAT repeat domain-containing protein [Deltaproteobacteria bacterium]